MNSSRPGVCANPPTPLNAKKSESFAPVEQPNLFQPSGYPGSYDDDAVIRGIVSDGIHQSDKSCDQIAGEMGYLLGRKLTGNQLYARCAQSKDNSSWPAAWDRAFCKVTGDDRLLRSRAELAGYKVVTETEGDLLELGRAYLIRKRAAEKMEELETRLREVSL